MSDITAKSCAVILAGGQGKRMKSDLPKPMFEVLGLPMLDWSIRACEESGIKDICVVTGFNHEIIEEHLNGKYHTVFQSQRMGTGHAVMMAMDWLRERTDKNVLILNGDAPFMDKETILGALSMHEEKGNAVTIITAELEKPHGYGRIIRNDTGVCGIVEENDATVEQKKIREINSGAYWFCVDRLIDALGKIVPVNSQGEYYLTDSVYILFGEKYRVDAYISSNSDVVLGANDRKGLLLLNNTARSAIINKLMDEGVEFTCTDGVTIGRDVTVGNGTVIMQGVILKGKTEIGANCVIGPNCIVENCTVGNDTRLNSVQAYDSVIDNNVKIGPFVHIRPGSHIKSGVKIGDFVEIKNSEIGDKTSISHLTYIGDSTVGKRVNFGCGTCTANYDGRSKYHTTIGDGAFIGCNTNLVSPVNVGKNAYTAAGSTVTKDIPDGALAIDRTDMHIVEGFSEKKLGRKK